MNNAIQKGWRTLRWPLGVVLLLYIALVVYRVPAMFEKDKTEAAVAKIHAQKITLADVQGAALPPAPNAQENNATVAGIDKNNNGIRDDVELAIFKLYPNSARIRAAELQYAMTEQLFLTDVFNTETWKAVAEENSRAALCMLQVKANRKEVQELVDNTESRKDARTKSFEFITSHGDAPGEPCDVSL